MSRKKCSQPGVLWKCVPWFAAVLCLVGESARAQSASPGYVDLSEHMRKMDEAARIERCQRDNAQKKKRDRKYKPVECDPEAAARAAAPPAAPAEEAPPPERPAPTPRQRAAAPRRAVSAPVPPPPAPEPVNPDDAELVTRRRAIVLPAPAPAAPANDNAWASRSDFAAPAPIPAPRPISEPIIEPQEAPGVPPSRIDEAEPVGTPGTSNYGRPVRGGDELLVGGGVLANTLTLGGDVQRDTVATAFVWRALSDQQGSVHNTLLFRVGGEPCEDGRSCSVRATGLIGFSPAGRDSIPSATAGQGESLAWSSLYFGAGLKGRFASGVGLEAFAQVQSLSMTYSLDMDGTTSAVRDASLGMLKLGVASGFARGGFELRVLLSDTIYVSGSPGASSTAPLRGVFYDPELRGLASGPEGFFGKLEARYRFASGFSALVSYGYLGYAGVEWASANVLAAQLGQDLGRFTLGLGLSAQLDALSAPTANQGSLTNVFVSGSLQAHFN